MNIKQPVLIIAVALFLVIFLSACSSSKAADSVLDYLNALVNKDAGTLSVLSCADWEPTALLELDSFAAVEAKLENVSCSELENAENFILVKCEGKIIATYNNEDQELDLTQRTYQVVFQNGEYLVCGYR